MNRLTITLDDDIYAVARSHAIATKTSISKAIADLITRRNPNLIESIPVTTDDPDQFFDPELGILLTRSRGPITNEDVQRCEDDEDIHILEAMGLTPEQIRQSLER